MGEEKEGGAVSHLKYLIGQVKICKQSPPQISRVDEQLRQVKEKDYEPEIVAIGPIHRAKDRLKEMEHHKVRYLHKLVQKNLISIELCVEKLRGVEERARRCYSDASGLDTEEFVAMLLLDGCFVIELVRKYWQEDPTDNDDPLFESDYTLSRIKRDLMLLENQLPFFVLNLLFDMIKTNDPDENLQYLVLFFVVDILPWTDVLKTYSKSGSVPPNADHLLALIYQSCFPVPTKDIKKKNGYRESNAFLRISPASELRKAGVRLKGSKGNSLLDASFLGGILHLPPIHVSDNTESLLRNLIAYELRLTGDRPKQVTDYAFLMSCLINSSKDIAILRRRGIVSNFLGGDDMLCHMFNGMGSNVVVLRSSSRFCYSDVFERLSRRRRGLPPRVWIAKLRMNYFKI